MKAATAVRENHLWERSAPCRERTDECDTHGGCLRCFAACGEACREPVIVIQLPEGER